MADLSAEQTIANAPALIEQFEQLVEHVALEKKGIRFSEMFFLYCTVRGLAPGQIVESGRARAQAGPGTGTATHVETKRSTSTVSGA